jgi:hypothetical protein
MACFFMNHYLHGEPGAGKKILFAALTAGSQFLQAPAQKRGGRAD